MSSITRIGFGRAPASNVTKRARFGCSGSESSAHFRMGDVTWVSLATGVHPYQVGQDHHFYMDTAQAFYFAPDGALVA